MRPARLARFETVNLNQQRATPGKVPAVPPRMLFQIPDIPTTTPPNSDPAEEVGPKTIPNSHVFLANQNASLFDPTQGLGSSAGGDHREHPYFRTEMLSKVMNLSTVRTHQYAVWLTVGFFEVVKPGNPQIAAVLDPNTGISLGQDQLGRELDADIGKSVRFRAYFLLDRTKATGFNPYDPEDFRALVTFRRRIE